MGSLRPKGSKGREGNRGEGRVLLARRRGLRAGRLDGLHIQLLFPRDNHWPCTNPEMGADGRGRRGGPGRVLAKGEFTSRTRCRRGQPGRLEVSGQMAGRTRVEWEACAGHDSLSWAVRAGWAGGGRPGVALGSAGTFFSSGQWRRGQPGCASSRFAVEGWRVGSGVVRLAGVEASIGPYAALEDSQCRAVAAGVMEAAVKHWASAAGRVLPGDLVAGESCSLVRSRVDGRGIRTASRGVVWCGVV